MPSSSYKYHDSNEKKVDPNKKKTFKVVIQETPLISAWHDSDWESTVKLVCAITYQALKRSNIDSSQFYVLSKKVRIKRKIVFLFFCCIFGTNNQTI